jgi:hypothetical protein
MSGKFRHDGVVAPGPLLECGHDLTVEAESTGHWQGLIADGAKQIMHEGEAVSGALGADDEPGRLRPLERVEHVDK